MPSERHSVEQKADLLLAGAHAASCSHGRGHDALGGPGTTGIYARNPLERHFRDAQTLRHHGFLSENRFEAAGQVYFGVEPEFAMVAF
jgi:indole-3-acetate monooxygenase